MIDESTVMQEKNPSNRNSPCPPIFRAHFYLWNPQPDLTGHLYFVPIILRRTCVFYMMLVLKLNLKKNTPHPQNNGKAQNPPKKKLFKGAFVCIRCKDHHIPNQFVTLGLYLEKMCLPSAVDSIYPSENYITYPLWRDHFKRKLHLPTINFQGIY